VHMPLRRSSLPQSGQNWAATTSTSRRTFCRPSIDSLAAAPRPANAEAPRRPPDALPLVCASPRLGSPLAEADLAASPCRVFAEALALQTFTADELRRRFDAFDADGDGLLSRADVAAVFSGADARAKDAAATAVLAAFDDDGDGSLDFAEFQRHVLEEHSKRRDPRLWPVVATMLLGGLSVGAIMPLMPIVVRDLGLSAAEYGLVVAAFASAKLLFNVPAAQLVDTQGRRALIVGGLGMIGLGFGAIALADSFATLCLARFTTGVGVTALLTGSASFVSDISTPLNRAQTMAPISSAFSAGTVAGPAVGGVLASGIGLSATFAVVAGTFGLNALYSRLFMAETKDWAPQRRPAPGADAATDDSADAAAAEAPRPAASYYSLLKDDAAIRQLCAVNALYWLGFGGANMTVLPLVLASDRFGLDAAHIGAIYAAQAAMAVVAAMPVAALADRFGPRNLLAPALGISALGMAAFPLALTVEQAAPALAVWTLGSALLGSAPTAAAANLVGDADRTKTFALVRMSGDVGLLLGSASVGALASAVSNDVALQATGIFMASSAAWYFLALRHPAAKALVGAK